MSKFKDSKNDEWDLILNVGMIEDIKEATSVDLDLLLTDPSKLADIFIATPKKLVEILFVICEEQIKERGLEPRDFGKRFDRSTLDSAAEAMIGAVVSFYPRSSVGKVIGEKLPELLRKLDSQIEMKAKEVMEQSKGLLNTHTSLPES